MRAFPLLDDSFTLRTAPAFFTANFVLLVKLEAIVRTEIKVAFPTPNFHGIGSISSTPRAVAFTERAAFGAGMPYFVSIAIQWNETVAEVAEALRAHHMRQI